MREQLLQYFAYDDWANRETAASVMRAENAPQKARKVMAHIVGTQWLWLARIQGGAAKMAVWPELAASEVARESGELLKAWSALLADDRALARRVEYKNSKGEPWSSTVEEIATHVVFHGAYHRGQIATLLRDSGHEPAYTDFIHAVRAKKL
jgi:uncharacterized damage-inducible protein DinB